jgi:hypothetical protein
MVCLNCTVILSMVLLLVSGTLSQTFLLLLLLIVDVFVLLLFAIQNKTFLDGLSELRGDFVDGLVIGFRH